jgi:phosphoribosylanthranilate isomerase
VTQVKICGITNVDDARCAAEAGADYLGFIFYPRSPRNVTAERCAEVVRAIRDGLGARTPRLVGVFVNETAEGVQSVLDATGLDIAQLHGDEPLADLRRLRARAFKAIRPSSLEQARSLAAEYGGAGPIDDRFPQLLVDAYHPQHYGGTGIPVDLEIAGALAGDYRLLLAGGLTPENVGMVVEQVRPWGVDVSSGVEREKGYKDYQKVRDFINAVRGWSKGEQ